MTIPELHPYIIEYLQFAGFTNTLECFEAEAKTKQIASKFATKPNQPKTQPENLPKICSLLKGDPAKPKNEEDLEQQLKSLTKQYNQVLQAGRQIFSVAVSCLQLLYGFKEVFYMFSIVMITLNRHQRMRT